MPPAIDPLVVSIHVFQRVHQVPLFASLDNLCNFSFADPMR